MVLKNRALVLLVVLSSASAHGMNQGPAKKTSGVVRPQPVQAVVKDARETLIATGMSVDQYTRSLVNAGEQKRSDLRWQLRCLQRVEIASEESRYGLPYKPRRATSTSFEEYR